MHINSLQNIEGVYVIGGYKVFREALDHPCTENVYLTHINKVFECDTFFPKLDTNVFRKIYSSKAHIENGIKFKFTKYQKLIE